MLFAVLFSLAIAGQEVTQTESSDGEPAACASNRQSDDCVQARFALTLARLPISAIENEAVTGAEVYRARMFDAWYQPWPVVSFERRPGHPPVVVVTGIGGRTLSAPVQAEVWQSVVVGSVFADRDLGRSPRLMEPAGQIIEEVCLDGWSIMVEMANSPAAWNDHRPVRRKISSNCVTNPATVFTDLLIDLAATSLPSCALLLEPDRDAKMALRQCLSLRGDTLAAADLLKTVERVPEGDDGPISAMAWSRWLAASGDARLNWAGEETRQSALYTVGRPNPTIAAFLAAKSAELANLQIYRSETGAEGANRGWVTGQISYDETAAGLGTMIADYRQVWTKENGSWGLESWTVEPFRPLD